MIIEIVISNNPFYQKIIIIFVMLYLRLQIAPMEQRYLCGYVKYRPSLLIFQVIFRDHTKILDFAPISRYVSAKRDYLYRVSIHRLNTTNINTVLTPEQKNGEIDSRFVSKL